MIEKKLHFVWIGDESKRPDNCINTWREKNPDYEVKVWGNEHLRSYNWHLDGWMRAMGPRELCGVADLMRFEILWREGGITLDADSICVRPLEDWLLETNEFAAWENEHMLDGGLLGMSALGAVKGSPFFEKIVKDFLDQEIVIDDMAWIVTGPLKITKAWRESRYPLTIYPSHYFYAWHHSGHVWDRPGIKFARQLWGSTHHTDTSYETLHEQSVDEHL